jgi:hypothetical protein
LPDRPVAGRRVLYSALERREIPRAFIARFHAKYKTDAACWLWHAGKYPHGYGMVNLGRKADGRQHTEYAHRVAYVLAKGDIPNGQVVMHTCDVRACVNPDHLVLGTQTDNIRDAVDKGRYKGPRKLTLQQVQEIHQSTEKGVRLAVRYGVSNTTITRIRKHGYRVAGKVA